MRRPRVRNRVPTVTCEVSLATLRKLKGFQQVFDNGDSLVSALREPALEVAMALLTDLRPLLATVKPLKGSFVSTRSKETP